MLSAFSAIVGFLSTNKKLIIPGLIFLGWLGSLFYVDRRRESLNDEKWVQKILNAPVRIDTVYETTPATISRISSGRRTSENEWRRQLDSIRTADGRSIAKLREDLERYTQPIDSSFRENLLVQAADTALSFTIPIDIHMGVDVIGRSFSYLIESEGAIQIPSRIIIKDHLVLIDRPWYEVPAAILSTVVAFLLGHWIW